MQGKVLSMIATKEVEVQEYELPNVDKGQVLMKVINSNVCGSDVHMWEGEHLFKNHVLGHEVVGEIVELGEGVTTDYAGQNVALGDRIVPVYYSTCQKCSNCLKGLFNLCEHGSDYWAQPAKKSPHFTGTFSTHYLIQADQYFYKVPDNIPNIVAAGANCGISQMYYAIDKIPISPSDLVVIQGAGGLGLYSAAITHSKGAEVIVIDSVDSRLEQSKKFGVAHTINMKEFETKEARLEEILRYSNGNAPDIVIDVTGYPPALDEAIRLVRVGGTILEIGSVSVEESETATILPGLIVRKCINIKGTLRYQPWYLQKTLRWLSKYHNKYDFLHLTDRTYSLEEGQEVLKKSYNREIARAVFGPV